MTTTTLHPKVRRHFSLVLSVGADTREDLSRALQHLAQRIECEEINGGHGAWGSPSDGGCYDVAINPDQTHDKYFTDLDALLRAEKVVPSSS